MSLLEEAKRALVEGNTETARTLLRDVADATRSPDVLDALTWIEGGMPDSKVGYGPDAPQLTPEQLGELAPASYVPAPESVPVRRRAVQGK